MLVMVPGLCMCQICKKTSVSVVQWKGHETHTLLVCVARSARLPFGGMGISTMAQ